MQPGRKRAPVYRLAHAIQEAENNHPPRFTPRTLAEDLGLNSMEPDNLTLIDRLLDGERSFSALRAVVSLRRDTEYLLTAINEGTANSSQQKVAQALGTVVSIQLLREQEICDGARHIAEACKVEGYIAPQAMQILHGLEPTPEISTFQAMGIACRQIFSSN
jgi:hypothetical protein